MGRRRRSLWCRLYSAGRGFERGVLPPFLFPGFRAVGSSDPFGGCVQEVGDIDLEQLEQEEELLRGKVLLPCLDQGVARPMGTQVCGGLGLGDVALFACFSDQSQHVVYAGVVVAWCFHGKAILRFFGGGVMSADVWRYDQVQAFSGGDGVPGWETVLRFFAARPSWMAAGGCGVVTAADSCYFPGLQLLAASLADRCPLQVWDLGLSQWELSWLQERGVVVTGFRDEDLLVPRNVPMWQTWNKPLMISSAMFRCALWVDSDCIVVGDLGPLFRVARQRPLVFSHPSPARYSPLNFEGLYEAFPVRGPRLAAGVQAAVVGVGGKSACSLLSAWAGMVSLSYDFEDGTGCRAWDQGALCWSIEKLGLAHVCRRPSGWNRFCFPGQAFSAGTVESFFESFTVAAGDVVLHFVNRPKYWCNWGRYVFVG